MRHRHYSSPRQLQVQENQIEITTRNVVGMLRRGSISTAMAVQALREVGMFETEIAEVLA